MTHLMLQDAQGMGPSSRRPRSGFNNDNAQPPKPAYHVVRCHSD